ncbi:ATP-binding protein [Paenibacillus sp. BSR1-1]|uniref:sensor histidine kinase n=1 Tax=Paenibacillus sp. BSR1-1 TaxID=3020845 RepID=UPI0025AF1F59|nr:ATP-binding protein [Paenibacillus sp. BSR1-1]MDN3017293.1 ATP-binding protein [Paenibacillus sp. BSR1-1]
MNLNPLSFIRSVSREKDVFKSAQGKLTRIYSGILMLFLILFIVIVYFVLHFVIMQNQEKELQSLVNQEAAYIEEYLLKNNLTDLHEMQNQEVVFAGVNQYFYYVVGTNGEVMMEQEANRRIRPDILRILQEGHQNEIQKKTLRMERRGNKGEFHPSEVDQDIRLIIASKPIYYKGQFIGQLYAGKDISFVYQLFHWVLIILVALGGIFFGIAIAISTKMSKRAMVPISGAFLRQREFVADASHELRTPLSVLLSSIDAIEMTIEPQKEDFSGKILSNMRQEVKRMTHLVSDLLTLARSDSNTIELKTETFDFRPYADKALESVSPLAAAKQISLNLESPAVLMAVGDPERLSQLLYILLDNAIKYTPNEGKVKLFLSEEGQELGIAVQDTGIGIEREEIKQIFERFYRSDKSRSRQMGGHGLGLSIAKWIVDTHKGTIKVSSEIGKGSTFIVRIPFGLK